MGAASSAANATRLRQALTLEEATSAFTSTGELSANVIKSSTLIIGGSKIENPAVIAELTKDDSNIEDWGEVHDGDVQESVWRFQVHYHMNQEDCVVEYGIGYKVVFNSGVVY